MAEIDPLVLGILAALDETPLRRLAEEGRRAIADLPDPGPETPQARATSVESQLAAIRESILAPLKAELEALEVLPGLARELGLSDRVDVLIPVGDDGYREVRLTGGPRVEALGRLVEVLGRTIEDADRRARDAGSEAP